MLCLTTAIDKSESNGPKCTKVKNTLFLPSLSSFLSSQLFVSSISQSAFVNLNSLNNQHHHLRHHYLNLHLLIHHFSTWLLFLFIFLYSQCFFLFLFSDADLKKNLDSRGGGRRILTAEEIEEAWWRRRHKKPDGGEGVASISVRRFSRNTGGLPPADWVIA